MRESYGKRLATHTGPKSCEVIREGGVEALTEGGAGRGLSCERTLLSGRRRCERQGPQLRHRQLHFAGLGLKAPIIAAGPRVLPAFAALILPGRGVPGNLYHR